MTIDKVTLRNWTRQIRDILNSDWDPIGGCPEDEYERYAGKLASMLNQEASDDELLNYLEWAEVEHMGLGQPFDKMRAEKVIAALKALKLPSH